jgi:hypothetical protein
MMPSVIIVTSRVPKLTRESAHRLREIIATVTLFANFLILLAGDTYGVANDHPDLVYFLIAFVIPTFIAFGLVAPFTYINTDTEVRVAGTIARYIILIDVLINVFVCLMINLCMSL